MTIADPEPTSARHHRMPIHHREPTAASTRGHQAE